MADVILLTALGAALVLAGVVLLLVATRHGRHTQAGQLGDLAWDTYLPEPAADLAPPDTPTVLMTAVQPDPPARGRHWYPGEAEDTGAVPRHGWRPDEQEASR